MIVSVDGLLDCLEIYLVSDSHSTCSWRSISRYLTTPYRACHSLPIMEYLKQDPQLVQTASAQQAIDETQL